MSPNTPTITSKTTIAELGALVCEARRAQGLDAFLSGGAVVSVYTDNRYESFDLDFVSLSDRDRQGLDQAVWVAMAQNVDLKDVKAWSKIEGSLSKFEELEKKLSAEWARKRNK
jgi:hypothetical protein